MYKRLKLVILFLYTVPATYSQTTTKIWLDDLSIPSYSESIPSVSIKTIAGGDSIQLNGIRYQRGLGTQSTSVLYFLLDGKASSFSAVIGADDKANKNLIFKFYVIGDRKILFESGEMKAGDAAKKVEVDLTGIRRLGLLVIPKEEASRSYSDWANAQFTMLGNNLPLIIPNDEEKYILTPAPSAKPRINSPSIFGATPGNPFLFTIVATGQSPVVFAATNLPGGLTLDAVTGIINGKVSKPGTYIVNITAKNKLGETTKQLRIRIGDTIALTPPIGWNGWNSWAREIDRDKVIASANALVNRGLSNHGWTYINIDDAWQGQRGGKWDALQANEKFPDFKNMIDLIHAKGLKIGVYSTPWITSYAGYAGGSSNFESGIYPHSVKNNKRAFRYIGANAKLEMNGDHLPAHIPNSGEKYMLTPAPKKTPSINSSTLFGVTPGNPFLYTIAASGERPVQFSVENLPKELAVSSQTGIITGTIKRRGTYIAILKATNKYGEATKKLVIKAGEGIALTPPIGWNGWNAWETAIDREKVIASANAMVKSGLRDHGWSYINIDDAWQGVRGGPDTSLQPNEKFPDIKGMIDYIHSLGLKAGLYSTPYIASYGGYVGASSVFPNGGETHDSIRINRPSFNHIGNYRFEINDAKQMAAWGVDFLKYDWRIDVPSAERMSGALKKSGRDIIFSISNNAPFEKVNDWSRVSNMYRTGPDIKDSWTSLFLTAFSLDKWGPHAGPGHWSDADMMILGEVAIGPQLDPTRLTPDEQYSQVSIFSLISAPMLIGCPVEQLDAFTLNLLTNDEVIAINQDALGKPARLVAEEQGVQVWLKPLEDGSYAVGLFNIDGFGTTPASYFRWGDEASKSYEFDFAKIGLKGKWKIRNVWTQKEIGEFTGLMQTEIRHHGVLLIRMFPDKLL